MMDDIYFLNPCSIENLSVARASFEPEGFLNMRFKKWKRMKFQTYEVLKSGGYSTFNYATHLPQVVTKTNIRKIFETFQIRTPYLWEVLYGNMFRGCPEDSRPFLHTQNEPVSIENAEKAKQTSIILNHGNKRGWSTEFRIWLSSQYPTLTEVEQ